MKPTIFLISIVILFLSTSCVQNDNKLITKKIQYDVNIKSPNPDYDWWIQNLPGAERDMIVEMIIEGAKSGEFKAYDYFNTIISPGEVKALMADTLVMKLMKTKPPYEEYDTTIINTIKIADIQRLRFLEKWEIDPKSLLIQKTVYAIAPIAKRIDMNGIERWQPLFWIYTDDDYLKGK